MFVDFEHQIHFLNFSMLDTHKGRVLVTETSLTHKDMHILNGTDRLGNE